MSLDEHGKKKTWLLTGWDNKISSVEEEQFRTNSTSTQEEPTFSRQILGAELNNIITDLDQNINSTLNQLTGMPKNQPIRRGAYNVSEKAIELFKDANYSTLPHEMAHFWLDNIWTYAKSGKASETFLRKKKKLSF